MRGASLALVLLLLVALPSRAHADDRVAAAVALWREGRDLLQQKRYEEACDRFARSHELDPSAGALFNLGDCSEKQGKIATAWSAYSEAETLAASKPGPANQKHARDAHEAAERLLPRLSRLKIVVAKTPALAVTRNGHALEAAALNVVLPVDAGPQTIAASAPEHRAWQTTIDLVEGTTATVEVPELEAIPRPFTPIAPPPKERSRQHVALGLEIGGGAFVVAGLALGGIAIAKWSSITDECKNALCRTDEIRQARTVDHDSATTFATLSTVGIGVGIVALAVGTILHLTAPNDRR